MATTTNFGWTTPDDTALVKDGASAIRSLGSAIDTSLGGAWISYTPTFSGGTWAVGNGTFTSKYKQINKTIFVKGLFTFGSTTVKDASAALSISLPFNAVDSISTPASCTLLDSGTQNFLSVVTIGTSTFSPQEVIVSGTKVAYSGITATSPFTWATNDQIRWLLVYETV